MLGNITNKVTKFITIKWIEVHDQSGNEENIYKSNKQIRFKTSMLQSGLCDYSDAYIFVKGTTIVEGANNRGKYNRSLIIKNNAPFISCISNINNTLVDEAQDLDKIIPM